jgi:hypothetical protein
VQNNTAQWHFSSTQQHSAFTAVQTNKQASKQTNKQKLLLYRKRQPIAIAVSPDIRRSG